MNILSLIPISFNKDNSIYGLRNTLIIKNLKISDKVKSLN